MQKHLLKKFLIISAFSLLLFVSRGEIGFAAGTQDPSRFDITHKNLFCFLKECVSQEFAFKNSANMVVVEWPAETRASVRFFEKKGWSSWIVLQGESDTPDEETDARPYQVFVRNRATKVQVKTESALQGTITISTASIPGGTARAMTSRYSIAAATGRGIAYIPRSQWLDGGIELASTSREKLWKTQYDEPKKIVIHHTASSLSDSNGDGVINQQDYVAMVRAVYYYHASVRRWGDIGYQYIIDPEGNVYEGKFGGDGVVGGHAYRSASCKKFAKGDVGFNYGTVGIALLGTYTQSTMPVAMRASLINLVADTAYEFSIDPMGSSHFMDQVYPNIIGHRDVDCTECPGDGVYGDFDALRVAARSRYDELARVYPKKYQGQILAIDPPIVSMKSGEAREVKVSVRNTGTATWRNFGTAAMHLVTPAVREHFASLEALNLATTPVVSPSTSMAVSAPTTKPYRVASLSAPNTPPGEVATFVMKVTQVPAALDSIQKYLIALGDTGYIDSIEASVPFENTGIPFAGSMVATQDIQIPDQEVSTRVIRFKNRGTEVWKQADVRLTVRDSRGTVSALKSSAWKKNDGQFSFKEKEVKPGEEATFTIPLNGDVMPQDYALSVSLLAKNALVSGSDVVPVKVAVVPQYVVRLVGVQFPQALSVKTKGTAAFAFENVGPRPLKNIDVLLWDSTGKKGSPLRDASSWRSSTIAARVSALAPNQTASFTATLLAPKKAGDYAGALTLRQGTKKIYIMQEGIRRETLSYTVRAEVPKPKPKVVAPAKKK